jgi:hypothetical protein
MTTHTSVASIRGVAAQPQTATSSGPVMVHQREYYVYSDEHVSEIDTLRRRVDLAEAEVDKFLMLQLNACSTYINRIFQLELTIIRFFAQKLSILVYQQNPMFQGVTSIQTRFLGKNVS